MDFEGGLFWDSPVIAAIHGNQPKMVRYLISKGVGVNASSSERKGTRLMEAAKPKAVVELMIVQPVMELVIAAAEPDKLKTLSVEDWKKYVRTLTAPKRPSR